MFVCLFVFCLFVCLFVCLLIFFTPDTNISTSSSGSTRNLHAELALDDQEKARLAEKCKTTPMSQWKASMIVAWIELNMCLPQYAERSAENIKSGRVS